MQPTPHFLMRKGNTVFGLGHFDAQVQGKHTISKNCFLLLFAVFPQQTEYFWVHVDARARWFCEKSVFFGAKHNLKTSKVSAARGARGGDAKTRRQRPGNTRR